MAGMTGAFYAVLGYLPPLSRVISPPETHVQAPEVARKTSVPTPLDLISSPDPALWTRMVDLSSLLPTSVHQFNTLNPGSEIKLMAKCEHMNPGMSHKDRIAKSMLERAEKRGELRGPNGEKKTILAASSGNTGCSLALVGTLMGYDVSIITNAKCSSEKCCHIRSNGATLWLAESLGEEFPDVIGKEKDYMKQEDLLVEAYPDRFFSVNQYGNVDNMEAHYGSTGMEIWEQTNGEVSHFVMAGSTGGTIMGVGRYLKEKSADVQIVLADPEKSHLSALVAGRSDAAAGDAAFKEIDAKIKATGGIQVEGAGKASLTGLMTQGGGVLSHVDEAISINDFDAFDHSRAAGAAGMLVGGSAGLNIAASKVLAQRCAEETPRAGGVTIVTLLCDHGIKYLSKVYNDEWLAKHDTRPPAPAGGNADGHVLRAR